MQPQPTAYGIVTDYALQQRLVEALEASTKLLEIATDQLGNTRLYEEDAASYLGVKKDTMYRYREKGLVHEKIGNVISYRRKDLDAWRSGSRTQHGPTSVY